MVVMCGELFFLPNYFEDAIPFPTAAIMAAMQWNETELNGTEQNEKP